MDTISLINKLIKNYDEDYNEIIFLFEKFKINNQYQFIIFLSKRKKIREFITNNYNSKFSDIDNWLYAEKKITKKYEEPNKYTLFSIYDFIQKNCIISVKFSKNFIEISIPEINTSFFFNISIDKDNIKKYDLKAEYQLKESLWSKTFNTNETNYITIKTLDKIYHSIFKQTEKNIINKIKKIFEKLQLDDECYLISSF